jgi:hypothetical protein
MIITPNQFESLIIASRSEIDGEILMGEWVIYA